MKTIIPVSLKNSISTKLFLLLATLFFSKKTIGQEQVDFGQYMLFHPIVNTAASGSFKEPVITAFGRKQWIALEGAPSRLGSMLIIPFKVNTIGLTVQQESIGIHNKQAILANYTHKVKFNDNRQLAFGLGAGIKMITSRYTRVSATDDRDFIFSRDKSAIAPDMNFSIYFFSKEAYFGVSIPGLIYTNFQSGSNDGIKKESHIATKYWHYYFLGGYLFKPGQKVELDVSGLAKITLNTPINMDFNARLTFDNTVGFGVSYKTEQEMLFFAHYFLNNRIKIGYSYHTYWGLNNRPLSGHEVLCTIILARKRTATTQSPRF